MKNTKLLLIACASCSLIASAWADKVPLKLELPKPLFVGTPVPVSLPNLEPSGTKHPELMVPEGTKLLSKEKTVTSSDEWPVIGELEMVTDDDKEGTDGTFVELGPDKQWVQIDLGAEHAISAVAFWHYHMQARVYHDVIIEVSNDPEFKEDVTIIYNNDHDNSYGKGVGKDLAYIETADGRVVDGTGKKAQYVRLHSKGSTSSEMNHYIEVEVYGL